MTEPLVVAGASLTEPAIVTIDMGTIVAYTAAAPGKEAESNQDAIAVIPGEAVTLLAVADGLGGHRGGAEASRLLVHALRDAIAGVDRELVRAKILSALEEVDRMLAADPAAGASTVVVVEVTRETVRSYHVGDAGAVLVGQRGRLKLRTVDHSPVGYGVAAGMLDEREAMHHDDRHLVSNAVGVANMRVEMGSELALAPKDTLVLGSDGLFDNLHLDEIVEIVRAGRLEAQAEAVITTCRERMTSVVEGVPSKPDDLSFILFRPA